MAYLNAGEYTPLPHRANPVYKTPLLSRNLYYAKSIVCYHHKLSRRIFRRPPRQNQVAPTF